jgi:hypothetical protein
LSDNEKNNHKNNDLWGVCDGGPHRLRRHLRRYRFRQVFKKHVDRKTLAISYSPIGTAEFSVPSGLLAKAIPPMGRALFWP